MRRYESNPNGTGKQAEAAEHSRSLLSPTARSTVQRYRERAGCDRQELYDVLDVGFVCHLGFVAEGAPVVLPSVYGRVEESLFLHASTGARSSRVLGQGEPICVTVTHVDAIVYAREVAHNSVNYRSAVIHGRGRRIEDEDEKLAGLQAIAEQAAPGAWRYAAQPGAKDLARVAVMAVDLTEASVKTRLAPPNDHGCNNPTVWAGVLPIRAYFGTPIPEEHVPDYLPPPKHVRDRVL